MTASAQVSDTKIFLGSAAGSSGTFAANVYAPSAGKVAWVEVVAVANDTTGNNGASIQIAGAFKLVAGNATQCGSTDTPAAVMKDASFTTATLAFSVSAGNVVATFTNGGTNAADVAYYVTIFEIA